MISTLKNTHLSCVGVMWWPKHYSLFTKWVRMEWRIMDKIQSTFNQRGSSRAQLRRWVMRKPVKPIYIGHNPCTNRSVAAHITRVIMIRRKWGVATGGHILCATKPRHRVVQEVTLTTTYIFSMTCGVIWVSIHHSIHPVHPIYPVHPVDPVQSTNTI